MKLRLLSSLTIILLLLSFAACTHRSPDNPLNSSGQGTENSASDKESISAAPQETPAATDKITKEDAIQIALSHAGFTSDEVSRLYAELDFDDRIHKYEVQFYQDRCEYDYDIDAYTGTILSYDKDFD